MTADCGHGDDRESPRYPYDADARDCVDAAHLAEENERNETAVRCHARAAALRSVLVKLDPTSSPLDQLIADARERRT